MAQLIDGKKLAADIKERIRKQVERLPQKPCLAVIMVGDDEASQIYVRNKEKTAEKLGIKTELYRYEGSVSASRLIDLINELNQSPHIHGILLQLPLPKHLDPEEIISHISPQKDVDGLTAFNRGKLMLPKQGIVPCTPKGCLEMIKSTGVDLDGKTAVIVGRSLLVGNPMGQLLLRENCTLIQTHSHTKHLGEWTKQADILVVAAGHANLIRGKDIKEGAVVIDVGISRMPDGKLCGDVCFDEAFEKAGFISPVPGGVGPMTIAMLFQNTLECAAFFLPHLSDVIKLEK